MILGYENAEPYQAPEESTQRGDRDGFRGGRGRGGFRGRGGSGRGGNRGNYSGGYGGGGGSYGNSSGNYGGGYNRGGGQNQVGCVLSRYYGEVRRRSHCTRRPCEQRESPCLRTFHISGRLHVEFVVQVGDCLLRIPTMLLARLLEIML